MASRPDRRTAESRSKWGARPGRSRSAHDEWRDFADAARTRRLIWTRRSTNGEISVTGLKFETSDQSRRRLSARINGGGTPIGATTNGAIRIGAP